MVKKSSQGVKEERNFKLDVSEDDKEQILEGYAVVFESPATHGFTEIIDKRALDNTDLSDVALRYNHKDNVLILARTRNNSLTLMPDNKGLYIRAKLINTSTNNDIYAMVKSGLLEKMSFSFTIGKDEWDYEKNERRILSIDKIFDVSIVDHPFYDDTEVFARSKKIAENKQLSFEKEKINLLLDTY